MTNKKKLEEMIKKVLTEQTSTDVLLSKLQKQFPNVKFKKQGGNVICSDRNLFNKYTYSQFDPKPKSHQDLKRMLKEPTLIIDPANEDTYTVIFTLD